MSSGCCCCSVFVVDVVAVVVASGVIIGGGGVGWRVFVVGCRLSVVAVATSVGVVGWC